MHVPARPTVFLTNLYLRKQNIAQYIYTAPSFKLLREILSLSFLDPTAESPCEYPSQLLQSTYMCSHGLKCVSRQSVDTHRETDNENLSATVQKQLTKHPHAQRKTAGHQDRIVYIYVYGNCCRTDKWTSLRTNMY